MTLFTKLLTLYIWLGVATLMMLLYRIAHFYQITTGLRSHYRFFLVPMTLFIIGMVRNVTSNADISGDVIGDLSFFLGGIALSLIGYYLLRLMTGGR